MKLPTNFISLIIWKLGTLAEIIGEIDYFGRLKVFLEFERVASFLLLHALDRIKVLIFEAFHLLEEPFYHSLFKHVFLIV